MKDIEEIKNSLEEVDFIDEENKLRVYELLGKYEEIGDLSGEERDELLAILEDEVGVSEILLEFVDEMRGDLE